MMLELKQKKLFSGERHFSFKDKSTVHVILKSLNKHKEYLIDLAALDPKYRRKFVFAKKSLISFILFFSIGLIFYFSPALSYLELGNTDWFLSAAVVLCLISLILFLAFTRYERVFVSRHSKTPLIRFYNGLPNKEEFKQFTQFIQSESELRFEKLNLDLQQQRAGELKTIRRMFDEGLMTLSQYDRAKKKLLKLSDK